MSEDNPTTFVEIWNTSSDLTEVCNRTGKTRRQAISLSSHYRNLGCDVKCFPRPGATTALVGEVFNRWTVIEVMRGAKRRCQCECGTIRIVASGTLTGGHSRSCRCGNAKRKGDPKKQTPEYRTWVSMRIRCKYPHLKGHRNHAGRGIKVCERWENSFDAFFEDMGNRPSPKHSIDRINNDGDYEPGNCRWATRKEQANNTRMNVLVTLNGKTQTFSQWCEELNLNVITAYARFRKGWTLEEALTTPIDVKKRNRKAHARD